MGSTPTIEQQRAGRPNKQQQQQINNNNASPITT
jgi:hypothetical protein